MAVQEKHSCIRDACRKMHEADGRTLQVKQLMAPSLEISSAIVAVRHAVTGKHGSGKGATADSKAAAGESSDDDGFEATSMIVSLRCPLSGARIQTPARSAQDPD